MTAPNVSTVYSVNDGEGIRVSALGAAEGFRFGSGDTSSPEPQLPTIGGFVQLPQAWHSSAGVIQNLVEHAVGGVGIIHSAAGEQRANHHHLADWHYLYVVSGSFQYSEWPVAGKADDTNVLNLTVRAGQMIFTPPMRNHRLHFAEDTVMISISKLNRQHASHELDVVRL